MKRDRYRTDIGVVGIHGHTLPYLQRIDKGCGTVAYGLRIGIIGVADGGHFRDTCFRENEFVDGADLTIKIGGIMGSAGTGTQNKSKEKCEK